MNFIYKADFSSFFASNFNLLLREFNKSYLMVSKKYSNISDRIDLLERFSRDIHTHLGGKLD